MNLKHKILFIIIFLFINSNSFSNDSVAYVDMELIMNKSKVGKLITKKLSDEHNLNINYFKKKEEELKNKEKKIISQQNILEKSELEKQLKALRLEANKYRIEKNKRLNDISKKKLNATKILLQNINPILSEYAKKNSISILMQKKDIVIGKTELDKTNEILKLVDDKITKIDFE